MTGPRPEEADMKPLGALALVSVSFLAAPALAQGPPSVHVRAWIDGRSRLILDDDTAQWQHFDFAAPGRLDCDIGVEIQPTYLEEVAWWPVWPDEDDCENRSCGGCLSDAYVGLTVTLPDASFMPALVVHQARGSCAVVEHPSSANGYRVAIEFNDDPLAAAAWYDVDLELTQCEVTPYCTSTVNSSGNAATIACVGSLSVTANDMRLVAHGCPPGTRGLFFFGMQASQTPFANGWLCVSPIEPGLIRVAPVMIRPTGSGQAVLDMTRLPPYGTIAAGQTRYFQLWFRDLAGGGAGSNTSDALAITFCP
jgi:hypothetical protein